MTETVNESPYWTKRERGISVWKDPNGKWNYARRSGVLFTASDKISNCPHQVEKWISEESSYKDLKIECAPNL